MGRLRVVAAVALVLGAGTSVALAQPSETAPTGPIPRQAAAGEASLPFFDVRAYASRRPLALSPDEREARLQLARELGRQAVIDIDPLTGTPRALGRLDGTLSDGGQGGARSIALDYAARRATALGLDDSDLQRLVPAGSTTSPDGITHVRWRQLYKGIPAYDNDLRISVADDGRVVNLRGSPRHDLSVDSISPDVSAVDALKALMANVGVERKITVQHGPSGPRRETSFAGGDMARLVLFGTAPGTVRLAWHLTYRARPDAWYDAVVDARSADVLRRANLVRNEAAPSVTDPSPTDPGPAPAPAPEPPPAPVPPLPPPPPTAMVWDQFPGAQWGGTARSVDLTPYLEPGPALPTRLQGPNAHVWSDIKDDNAATPTEEVPAMPDALNASTFSEAFTDLSGANPGGGCAAARPCSWVHGTPNSWQSNRRQNAIQVFYFVNRFHDHLAAPPIGFGPASGSFDGNDRLIVHTDDGAAGARGLPDDRHVNNANVATPADGRSPVMQLYLFRHDAQTGWFRDVNGGDDAATVYHEYTHGMTSRLVTDAEGHQALNSPQSWAMGEAWSDWYAMDFLVGDFPQLDSGADGEVDIGAYTDATPHRSRTEPMDCPVGSTSPNCPGTAGGGPGGYTYGDFGRVFGRLEPHADGEIWGQTLWDLRAAIGSQAARRLITGALRMSPPEPSFLDMRNAILQADAADPGEPGRHRTAIWTVFARRGMGFFAGARDGTDTRPVEDFSLPPAPGGPSGAIAGRVTSADTGLPLAGVPVGISGHATDESFGDAFATRTGADGTYRLANVPAGTYPKLVIAATGGYNGAARAAVVVASDATAQVDVGLSRDWAATAGGTTIAAANGDDYAAVGCGPAAVLDQQTATGWSSNNPSAGNDGESPNDRSITLLLPAAIEVSAFGMDPGSACGDGPSAATRGYKVETSPDGVTFTVAARGEFTAQDAQRLNRIAPSAGATGVRYVRLTLVSAQDETPGTSGRQFIDFSEFEVFGGPPNTLPSGVLAVRATANTGEPVHFDAGGFRDPDSAITGYDWDLDGDGTVDKSTAGPVVDTAYDRPQTVTARVMARDYRGGAGIASARLQIIGLDKRGLSIRSRRVVRSAVVRRDNRRGRVVVRVSCPSRCRVRAQVTVSKAVARRLGLGSHRTIGVLRLTITRTTGRPRTIVIDRRVRRKLRNLRHVRAAVRVTVAPARGKGHTVTTRRMVIIRG